MLPFLKEGFLVSGLKNVWELVDLSPSSVRTTLCLLGKTLFIWGPNCPAADQLASPFSLQAWCTTEGSTP